MLVILSYKERTTSQKGGQISNLKRRTRCSTIANLLIFGAENSVLLKIETKTISPMEFKRI